MTTIIHLADRHLGRAAFGKTTEDGSNLRETLIYENALEGTDVIIKERPDVVVDAGDGYDTVKPKTKAQVVYLEILERFQDAGIQVVMICGNHDMQKNAHTTSPLEILQRAHPEVHFAYSFKYERFEIGDTIYHCIPNMLHPADYVKAAKEIKMSTNHNNVLVTHGLASTIKDKRLSTVAEFEIPAELANDESFDVQMYGHYHARERVGPRSWYSGSQEHLTYGEIHDLKGALKIDPGRQTVDPLPLPCSRMIDLGTLDCYARPNEAISASLISVFEANLSEGDMAQITLDFGTDLVRTLPDEYLNGWRECLLDIKIRARSQETGRQCIQQQDLHAINYVDAWNQFMGPQYPLSETLRAIVQQKGSETLKTVMANHREETA